MIRRARRPFIKVGPSTDGRDRWMIGLGSTIYWAWSAPKWLSFRRWI